MIHDFLANQTWHSMIYVVLAFGWDDVLIMLAVMIVSATITALTAKRPSAQNQDPALLADFNLPQIAEGTAQVVVFGDCWLTEWQVLWYGDLNSETIPGPSSGKK